MICKINYVIFEVWQRFSWTFKKSCAMWCCVTGQVLLMFQKTMPSCIGSSSPRRTINLDKHVLHRYGWYTRSLPFFEKSWTAHHQNGVISKKTWIFRLHSYCCSQILIINIFWNGESIGQCGDKALSHISGRHCSIHYNQTSSGLHLYSWWWKLSPLG